MKKVCYIINSVKRCGPVNVLTSMIRGIDREKYSVSLITLLDDNDKDFLEDMKKLNIDIYTFDYPKKAITLLKRNEITKKIDQFNFDVIHVHGHITAMIVKNVKTKKIITIHNKMLEDFKNTYGNFMGCIINQMYVLALKNYDDIVCCSKSSYKKCKNYISRAKYIRNGIYFENEYDYLLTRNKIRNDLGIPMNATVFIFAGNYSKLKNVLKMLKLFSITLKDNEYLICLGNGDLFESARKYSSKNIIQLGFVENVTDYMIASDIYTSFSTTEGLPVSIIEALHFNNLLLLSDIDSHEEILNIDSDFYVGEIFNENNFSVKKELVSNSKRNDSVLLQNKYLSEKSMMKLYESFY